MSYAQTALDQLEKGQLADFKKQYALALRHDDDDTLFSLAEELYSLGFLNQSRRIYEKLLAKYPEEDELRTNLADIAIDEDKDDQALDYLNQVKLDSPAYVEALMVAADLYQTQELFEVSEQKLLTAKKVAPDEPVITFALAELYFTMREFRKAIPLYLDLITAGTTELSKVNLVERLGVAYANAGRFEQAIGYLKQIHSGDMTPDVKFETAFTYLQLKDRPAAIRLFNELKDTDAHYTSLYPYLGQALEQENRLAEALTALQEGLGVDQYNEKLWLQAAHVATRLDDEALTEKYLKKGHDLDHDDLSAVIQLSNLYVKQERWDENTALVVPYLQEDNTDPQLYWNLAVTAEHQEDFAKARQYYDAAAPYFMDQADFLKPAIYFYREEGAQKQVVDLLKAYLKVVPDDQEMALMLDSYQD
ncbi:tetratricopeptide repeat protein [Levilactobacillus namurensis]|uniref:tetratricopeptide repeat protein n=1 Tax=Levilactobacillus namurensis TaxID=380393 RepID=UPI002232BBA3|nr:tetratricopeptide repeat protein [Levilactobacillus namurensis]MCW3777360.1 tetratricopeptide repeat protein [Levilactobacillus namurensis]MDT7018573.1 tetratricopeptide repeat protein [Levilactobacillus namurensis]WNN64445.1 tetratricopeptide repeat protein [Levilactobacillus namurensis]